MEWTHTGERGSTDAMGHNVAFMGQAEGARRIGYSQYAPILGPRGRDTRERIVQRAGELFGARGYHGTSIDDIAKSIGGSRAVVYQYFGRKDDIFHSLLEACEPAIVALGRGLGGLGAHSTGFENLSRWLDELAEVNDRYAAVIMEFPGIGLSQGSPPAGADAVSKRYLEVVAETLAAAGVSGLPPDQAAGALLTIAHMVNLYRQRRMFGLTRPDRTTASLAVMLQLTLFPDTPHEVFRALVDHRSGAAARVAVGSADPPALSVCDSELGAPSPIRQGMLRASSALFAERGYHDVSMADIAQRAGVGRATLYRHYRTKVAILAELTASATADGERVSAELVSITKDGYDEAALRVWLAKWVGHYRAFGGVIRAWYDGTVASQLGAEVLGAGLRNVHLGVYSLFEVVRLPVGVDSSVAAAVFLSALGRLTQHGIEVGESDDDVAAFVMVVLRRGVLNLAPS